MNNSNDSSTFVMGGIVAFLIVAFMAVKAIGELFKELKIAFQNFGQMMGAFVPMLWHCLLVVCLIAAIVAALGTTIWFCVSYFKMIKNIKESRSQLEYEVGKMKSELSGELRKINDRVGYNLSFVKQELAAFEDLLIEATKKPDLPPTDMAPDPKPLTTEGQSTANNDSNITNTNTDTNQSTEVQMSNPF